MTDKELLDKKKDELIQQIAKNNKAINDLEHYINGMDPQDLTISRSDYDMWVNRLQVMKDSIPWLESQLKELENS